MRRVDRRGGVSSSRERRGWRGSPRRRRRATLGACLLAATGGLAVAGGSRSDGGTGEPARLPDARTWVERLGSDTTAVERARLVGDTLRGTVVFRSPVTRVLEYRAPLDPSGWPRSVEGILRTPPTHPAGPADQRFRVSVKGSEGRIVTITGGDTTERTVELDGLTLPAPPRFPVPVALLERAAERFRSSRADSLALSLLTPVAPAPVPVRVRRAGPEELAVRLAVIPLRVELDAGGIESVDARGSTMNTLTRREAVGDLGALAGEFARRDARGGGFGTASPGDTVAARFGGASVEVRYSRPARRGREIWGGLVPFGEVWRTGANAATHLATDTALVLGGVEVRAGTYTLWSVHRPEGGTLIVNGQTGQWGTSYDPARDVARIPLEMERPGDPVERFTIAVEALPGEGDRGRLVLAWADRRYSVVFRVAG